MKRIDSRKVRTLLALTAQHNTSLADFANEFPAFFTGMLETLAGASPSWTDAQRQHGRQRALDAIGRQLLTQQGIHPSTQRRGLPVVIQLES